MVLETFEHFKGHRESFEDITKIFESLFFVVLVLVTAQF